MRIFLGTLVVLLVLASNAIAAPNFVVVLTDDQEDTGSMAYMPKVRSLIAEQGITFTNSFVNMPACAPSRASLLTGQTAHNHGVKANSSAKAGGWWAFKSNEADALPVWLKAAGYKTALLGKYMNDYGRDIDDEQGNRRKESAAASWLTWLGSFLYPSPPPERKDNGSGTPPVPAAWDLWYAFFPAPKYFNYGISENGRRIHFGDQPDDYSTDVLKNRAVKFIAEQAGAKAPFFMLIAPKTPHGATGEKGIPTPAPRHANLLADASPPQSPAFNEKDVGDKPRWVRKIDSLDARAEERVKRSYRAELQSLQSVDDLVEAVVKALQDAGKLDETFVIFTSDNGFLYGDHRLIGKFVPYEGSIRVPLMMRGPGIPKDQTRDQLVNNLDVVATIEQLSGATPGIVPDGRSLVPLFADAHAPWRSAILVEGGHDREKPQQRFSAVRTATRKYVKYGDDFEELYDLNADPHELDNKVKHPAYASDAATLRTIQDKLKACAGPGCWIP
jgi:arylsulfatase A-like enzyme